MHEIARGAPTPGLPLFVSAVAFGVGLANGLTVLIVGGAFIFGEVWIERSGESHPTFAIVWRVALRIALGATLLVLAIASSDGWGTALLISPLGSSFRRCF